MASGPHISANLNEAQRLIAMAAERGAKFVALPEYFALMGTKDTDKVAAREEFKRGPIQQFMEKAARQYKVWLVGAGIPLMASDEHKVRNSCLVYDHHGDLAARYDKMHLFRFEMGGESYSEQRTIEPGSEVKTVATPFGRLGLSVCYDLRFPELYRAMGDVDIVVVPSAFTETTGKAHWETLLRARAIENLAYVVAPAQGGYHVNGRETHGDTMIVDPWGMVLDRLPRGSGVVTANMNPEYIKRLRRSLPVLEHRIIQSS
jgi:nitrilase